MNERLDREDVPPVGERLVRGVFMLLFIVAYNVAEIVLIAIALLQFLIVVVTGRVNERLADFGRSLSAYAYQIFLFLTYNRKGRPWPFSDWPASTAE